MPKKIDKAAKAYGKAAIGNPHSRHNFIRKKEKATSGYSNGGSIYQPYQMYGDGTGYRQNNYQATSVLVNPAATQRYYSIQNYFPYENYRHNMFLYLTVPYLFATINFRADYSLGLPFVFKDKTDEDTIEEKYLRKRAKSLGFNVLFSKTAIHLDVYGNAFWYINRNEEGMTTAIKMIQPERVRIDLDEFGDPKEYIITYPKWKNRGMSQKVLKLSPDKIIHFKQNDIAEIPYGFSIIQPTLPILQTRSDLNNIIPIMFKAYAKPYRHFKLTDTEGLEKEQIDNIIEGMQKKLNSEIEPDSDMVTGDAWNISVIGAPTVASPIQLLEDLDQQLYAVTAVPEFFFKPKGSTDLNVNKADSLFKDRMKTRNARFIEQFTKEWLIPELDSVFPNSTNVPKLEFEDEFEVLAWKESIVNMFKEGVLTLDEARKELGLEINDIEQTEELTQDLSEQTASAFRYLMNKNIETAEKYQNGEINDFTLRSLAYLNGWKGKVSN